MSTPTILFRGILSSYKVARFPETNTNVESIIPLEVDGQSIGTYLRGRVIDGKLNGPALIVDEKGQTLFELNFVGNSITGPYKQYENGNLKAAGSLQDSLRIGEGWEYDSGSVVFHGFYSGDKRDGKAEEYDRFGFPLYDSNYENGMRADLDYLLGYKGITYKCSYDKVTRHFFRGEFDSSNQFHGKCIEVSERNEPIRLVRYDHGTLVEVLRLYAKSLMVEYNEGRCVFIGEYAYDPALYYPRCGVGEEYSNSHLVYSGEFQRDSRNGRGVFHCADDSLFLSDEWKEGEVTRPGYFVSANGRDVRMGNWVDVKPVVSVEQIDDDYSDSEFTVTFGSSVEDLSSDTCDVGVFEETIDESAATVKSAVERELGSLERIRIDVQPSPSVQPSPLQPDPYTDSIVCELFLFVGSSDLPVEIVRPSVQPSPSVQPDPYTDSNSLCIVFICRFQRFACGDRSSFCGTQHPSCGKRYSCGATHTGGDR